MSKILVFSLLCLCLHSPAWGAERVLLSLHGSNTIGGQLGPELVKAWLRHQHYSAIESLSTAPQEVRVTAVSPRGEAVAVTIMAHGSSTAFRALERGEADIGMASRPIKEKELQALASMGRLDAPESEYVLGLDGIAVIVHPDNPLRQLSKEQLRGIFAGSLRDWRQLGAGDGPVHVYARDDKSGTYDTFRSLVLGKQSALRADAQRFESNARLSDAVSADRNGIGFVGLPYIRQAKALAVLDGAQSAILPDNFTVATEDYALARRLYLYLPPNSDKPIARDFARYAISEFGQRVVAETGFVSQEIVTGNAAAGVEHEEYRALIDGAHRLSLNFRFHRGSAQLDSKAREDIRRLVEYLGRDEYQGRELILVGFSDQHESIPLYSLALSVNRADRVADLLISNGVAPRKVRGFGPAVTVAANDSRQGREKNRRVEVWLR